MCTRIAAWSHNSSRMWKWMPSPITSSRSPLTSISFQVLHSIANGASASRGTAILVEGASLRLR
jgi:hypothetical protein